MTSDVVPVKVMYQGLSDTSDVRVEVFIEGYKDLVSETTDRFHIINGSEYVNRFSVKLPSTQDLSSLNEDLNLIVRFSAKGQDSIEKTYAVKMQRGQYSLNLLSVDAPDVISVGDTYDVDAVVQNNGNQKLQNIYLSVTIPELGLSRKVYVGDLDEQDERVFNDTRSINRHDTDEKKVYLPIPSSVAPGTYDVEVEAYNYDTGVTVKRNLVLKAVQTGVLPVANSKTLGVGGEATYDVVLVNPNDKLVVYTITPSGDTSGFTVDISDPVVVVPAGSSRTVKVAVKANNDVTEGTHLIKVDVNSESSLVEQVVLTANVQGKTSPVSVVSGGSNDTVFILTVVLTIIFVVLLVILIVLLTRKPEEAEEFGETSYY